MSGLAVGLIALAALFADRAVRGGRRSAALSAVAPKLGTSGGGSRSLPWIRSWLWVVAAGAVGWVVGAVPGALVAASAVEIARRVRRRRGKAREAAMTHEQLADAVRSIVSGLRAGLSIPQSLGYAARESQPPLASGLVSLVEGLESGTPFDQAVDAWAAQAGGDDPRLLASVLRLHRRTGGDLPMVLDRVADTLRERTSAQREVRALTAQARLSGTILGVLPIGFFGFLWLTSRRDIEGALRSPAGLLSVSIGLVLEAGAFLWIRHLLEVR